ncbi:MAG: phytanoyl-CoA dioxygenase family protein [Abitibacteriaceae bacterium]|nr:phytanoyl-CoA dioxygenase family protein [Abditibacteriaceae bacterium]
MLTQEQVQFFRDNGYLKIAGAIGPDEVQELRNATQALIDRGPTEEMTTGQRKDYQYGRVRGSDEKILRRIEYIQGKGDVFVRLLANPVLLDAVHKVVGEQFVPTYDSVVIKMPGHGVEVPWHRDGGGPTMFYDDPASGRRFPAVNFDIYLDEANEQSGALWVVPGSNKDEINRAPELAKQGEYATVPGAIRVDMNPGDMLLHDVTLYHGSPETHGGPLRRVIYYEFRDMRFIDAVHRPAPDEKAGHKWPQEWTRHRLAVLQQALDKRRAVGLEVLFPEHPISNLRVPHEEAAQVSTRVPHPGWED